ncbi:hypothetical protein BDV27DRAFT_138052 [Aspergillus caelatus]|uniref:Uncharacterized protein n=1 Tax=Aspergillus caelatus TaxID=61420 RepID=A0A5N6ZPV5_9EURO|nr:uncharacterized protein BDV27DRAFT_138052 [Aspergillus caelatus]KAE8358220.1 hypothetical protein BDV27DRAFT_138052 [Aspergillus caelatus]
MLRIMRLSLAIRSHSASRSGSFAPHLMHPPLTWIRGCLSMCFFLTQLPRDGLIFQNVPWLDSVSTISIQLGLFVSNETFLFPVFDSCRMRSSLCDSNGCQFPPDITC